MRIGLASIRDAGGLDRVENTVRRFLDQWQSGEPDLESYWAALEGQGGTVSELAALVKADLQYRFDRGERPAAADYFERFSAIQADGEKVLSLVYEEFCQREERGEQPDPEQFCARYAAWTDSLATQLRYHRELSQMTGAAPPPPRYPVPGERFRQFHLTHELGRGGAARVFRARDETLGNREVALKVSADRGSEPSILGRLEHPHIVAVHTVVYQPENRLRGLCMPYRPGRPLDEVIRHLNPAADPPRTARALWDAIRRPAEPGGGADADVTASPEVRAPDSPEGPGWAGFPIRGTYAEAVAWIATTLARALHHAHQQGVYHRDVKPANVLLTFREGPQLLDFNLAHDPHSAAQAEAALRGGTLPYMAPEQLEAFLDPARWDTVGAAADVYSLGLVVREMLTGALPEAPDPKLPLPRAIQGLLDRRADLRPDLRRHENGHPHLPHALESIVGRCLAPRPDGRYPDAATLADDLDRFLTHQPLRHALNPSHIERATNWARRNVVFLVALSAVLLVAGTFLAWNFERLTRAPEQRSTFARAIKELNDNHPAAALPRLESLAREAPHSPVIALHQAMALASLDRKREAIAPFAHAWAAPGVHDILRDWGQRHPDFVTLARKLGQDMLQNELDKVGTAQVDPGRLQAVTELATRTFKLLHELVPDQRDPRIEMSAVNEEKKDFRVAAELVTRLINEIDPGELAKLQGRRGDLLWFHEVRARIQTKWGQSLLDQANPGVVEFDEASRHLHAALDDIAIYRGAYKGEEPGSIRLARVNYIRAEALLALGLLSERRSLPAEASRYFQEASKVNDLIGRFYAHLPQFAVLKQQVQESLSPPRPGS